MANSLLSCDVGCDVSRGVTGGYFQNGRGDEILEGNTKTLICALKTRAWHTNELHHRAACVCEAETGQDERFDRRQDRGELVRRKLASNHPLLTQFGLETREATRRAHAATSLCYDERLLF